MKAVLTLGLTSVLALGSSAVVAQTQPAAQAETPTTTEMQEVIITGTRRTDRTVAESSAPIDVIAGSELSAQSTSNLLDTLSNRVPSFIVGQNSISDAASFVRPPSLRGLPPDEMLVMLNGKRLNRSALVQVFQGGETELAFGSQGPDLSSIPSIAIKNLEILRDGASAQYGSDAIAGVLNYQFKDSPTGIEIDGRGGEYFPGNGYSRDGTSRELAANIGLPLGSQGFFNLSGEWSKDDQTVRNPTRPSALAFADLYPNLAPQLPHYPGPVQQWGTPPTDSVKLMANAGVKLDNNAELYLFANWANIQANESFNYRLPVPVNDPKTGYSSPAHPAFTNVNLDACSAFPAYTGCPANGYINDANIFNPGVQNAAFPNAPFYPAGFTPRFYGTTQESFAAAGYKGVNAWGMTYDISGTRATNSLAVSLKSSINPSLGPASPTSFYDGKFVQNETNFNVDVSYPWVIAGLASPLSVAAGAEWRDENYQQLLGDPASYAVGPYATTVPLYNCAGGVCTPDLVGGVQATGNGLSTSSNGYGGVSVGVDASQVSYAAYLDLEADVLKNLTLGIAGRFEDYSSFGNTTLGKFQARWKIVDAVALRGTVSTGFHAPTPGQSNVQTLSTTFLPGTTTQAQIGTYQVSSPIAQHFGATTLRPEESTNISAGVVLTPVEKLLVTVDSYQIDVRHRIGITTPFNVTPADIAALPALANVEQVQYFTNGFSTRTKGLDVVAQYPFDLDNLGRLGTTLAYSYNKSDVTSYNPVVIGPARLVDIQHYAPNNRANLSLDWSRGPWSVTLYENYYGTWRDQNDYPGQLFSAKETTDLDVAFQTLNWLTVAVGGRNIFNAYPDAIANTAASPIYPQTGGESDGEKYPRTGGPFGYNGAFWYVRFVAKF